MTWTNVEVVGNNTDPFSDDPEEYRTIIQLPLWDDEMAGFFWSAVNAPTYAESAVKTAALVRYVYENANRDGFNDGVFSILGRDS